MTSDGTWVYEWDTENRLVAMTMTNIANMPDTQRKRLEFAYDFQGRRIRKIVRHWSSGSWALDSDFRFVYDGWNLLTTLNSQLSLINTYLWGLDLSGTMDQAGGVGGLLCFTDCAGGETSSHFPCYDGNGNITGLIHAVNKSPSARYEYSPFGELTRATGLASQANPFRLSTRFADDDTGLFAYPKRVYSPYLGRWLTRDPAQEKESPNLYRFCRNRGGVYGVDPDGEFAPVVALGLWALLWGIVGYEIGDAYADQIKGEFLFVGGSGHPLPKKAKYAELEGLLVGGYNVDEGWNAALIGGVGMAKGIEGTAAGEVTWSQRDSWHLGDITLLGVTDIGPFGSGAYLNDKGDTGAYVYIKIFKYGFVGAGVDVDFTGSSE